MKKTLITLIIANALTATTAFAAADAGTLVCWWEIWLVTLL